MTTFEALGDPTRRRIVDLVREFVARGWLVGTVKHAHHDFDIDHPGKDSHLHRAAGAS